MVRVTKLIVLPETTIGTEYHPASHPLGTEGSLRGLGVKWPGHEAAEDKTSASQYMSTSLSSIQHG